MNRLTSLLAATLALQLLLAVALFWPRENPGETDARAALLELAAGEVDRLIISTADDSLLLHRGDEGWILPDYHKLPVQESRVNRVLLDLPALSRGWPIAGSANAAARFEVADEEFQRRVSFYAGEENRGELFVGTSPGFRKVHVRPAGDEKVYAVEFNSFELPVNPDEWLDKTLLQVRDLTRIEGLDFRLELDGERWLGDAGQEANTESVDALLSGLGSLRVNGAADIATASILAQLDAPPTLSVSAAGGNYHFRLYEMEDSYFIQREDISVYFSLSAYDYDRLNDVNAEALFAAGDDEEAEDDDAGE
jgi:hypothetical protein